MPADARSRSGPAALSGALHRVVMPNIVAAVVVFGLLVSGGVSLWLWRAELDRTARALEARGEVVVHAADDAIGAVAARLRAVAGLYVASELVTQDEFVRFVDGLGPLRGLDGIGYATEVRLDDESVLVPGQWLGTAESIDLMRVASDPAHRNAAGSAIRTRAIAATPFFQLPTDATDHVAIYWAVAADRSSPVAGYAVAVVDVAALTANHVPSAVADVVEWSVAETNASVSPGRQPERTWVGSVTVADRRWSYTVTPKPGSDMVPHAAGALLVFVAGATATGLAASGVHLRRQRTATAFEYEKLKELTRAKDQFLASVSHELRTPLTGVLGFAELLREGHNDLDADARASMIDAVADEASDIATIMEDLLVAARAELDLVTVACASVPVRAQVVQVLDALGSSAGGVRVVGDRAGELQATGDAGRIRQILRNLVTNARRYGGERVEIRLASRAGMVRIQVADSGAGLAAEHWDRIFDPYYRAHPEGTQPSSIGIGLTVARHLARLMDGDLSYRRDNGWSVFELVLPVATNDGEAPGVLEDTLAPRGGLRRAAG